MVEETLSSRQIYRGRVVGLRLDEVRLPDGRTASREIVEHGASVGVVAVDRKGQATLVRQYRHAVGDWLLEIVAGGVDEGEEIGAAAGGSWRRRPATGQGSWSPSSTPT